MPMSDVSNMPKFSARALPDDRAIEISVNAYPCLAQAGKTEILELAERDWGGCGKADEVANIIESRDGEVDRFLAILSTHPRMVGEARPVEHLRSREMNVPDDILMDIGALGWRYISLSGDYRWYYVTSGAGSTVRYAVFAAAPQPQSGSHVLQVTKVYCIILARVPALGQITGGLDVTAHYSRLSTR